MVGHHHAIKTLANFARNGMNIFTEVCQRKAHSFTDWHLLICKYLSNFVDVGRSTYSPIECQILGGGLQE